MGTKIKRASFDDIIEDIKAIETDLILLVVDQHIWTTYKQKMPLDKAFENKKVIVWRAPQGEKTKTFQEFQSCLEFFIEKGIHRNAHLIAWGGGAVSDFAGFVAASLLRGIPWSIIPTTLLSMVDASIGGKVAINANSGKNLIGAFHLPQTVWMSSQFLESLPKEELLSGKGEILKYAFLSSSVYEHVLNHDSLDDVIDTCATYKLHITEEDFKENGIRKILNLGHTLGHAIEKHYNISHGKAVMWGMALIYHLYGREDMLAELKKLKDALGWEEKAPPWLHKSFPWDKLMYFLSKDKKRGISDTLDIVLVDKIGQPSIENISIGSLESKLEESSDELRKFVL